ncbi:MAG: hypothetical protein ACYSTT_05000, partial [Planctomycetota bacterium]
GAFVLFRLRLKSKLRARIEAIRAAGYPVTCAELDKWYTIPENVENAAHTIIDAFWCYREMGEIESLPFIGQAELPARHEPLPNDMEAAIARYIADNNEALALLHKASTIEHCRYPLDLSIGLDIQLNHLHKIRKCIMLLSTNAIWHAENDQSQSAVNSVMSGFALARSLRNEPVIIPQLSRMACYGLSISVLERCINRTVFTDEQLADLDCCLINAEDHSTLACAYVGDRCFFLEVLKKPETLKPAVTVDGKQISPLNATFSEFYQAVGLADMDAMKYLDFIERYIEITKIPAYQRMKASDALEARLASLSRIHVFIHMLMPTLSRTAAIEIRSIAGLRAARAGLAVERYRLAADKLPDKLSDLVPVYLESVPEDPFDGNEIRYRKLETGFVVYSICEDLSDDGGKERTKESKDWDMTFIVER